MNTRSPRCDVCRFPGYVTHFDRNAHRAAATAILGVGLKYLRCAVVAAVLMGIRFNLAYGHEPEQHSTPIGAAPHAAQITISWKGFFGRDYDNPERAAYVVNDRAVGIGRNGLTAVLKQLEDIPERSGVLVLSDARWRAVEFQKRYALLGCGNRSVETLSEESVPFRCGINDFRAFLRVVESRKLNVIWEYAPLEGEPAEWYKLIPKLPKAAVAPLPEVEPTAEAACREWLKSVRDYRYGEPCLLLWRPELSAGGDLVHLKAMPFLEKVVLNSHDNMDAALVHLATLPRLQSLSLGHGCTNRGLAHLRTIASLRELDLGGSEITDTGLAQLRALPHIRRLGLACTRIGDAGMAHLRALPHLRILSLYDTRVTDAGLGQLVDLSLDELRLGGRASVITDAGMEYLKDMVLLRSLTLNDTAVTDKCLPYLKRLPLLSTLELSGPHVTEEVLHRFRNEMPHVAIR